MSKYAPSIVTVLGCILAVVFINMKSSELETAIDDFANSQSEIVSMGENIASLNSEIVALKTRQTLDQKISSILQKEIHGVVIIRIDNVTNPQDGGIGTGWFVKSEGDDYYIVTNHHVVEKHFKTPESYKLIIHDLQKPWEYEAELVGVDPVIDIAVLKVKNIYDAPWRILSWADHDEVRQGDPVVTIGHGLSLPWSVSSGIVTALNRYQMRGYNLMIQTDAVINQGNSGGPMMDLDGNVVGVVSSLLDPAGEGAFSGVGLTVAGWQAERSVNQIIEFGNTVYPDIDFVTRMASFEEMEESQSTSYAIVDEIETDTNAYRSGMRKGDYILKVDDVDIISTFGIYRHVLKKNPYDTIKIVLLRDGERVTIDLVIGKMDPEDKG